MSGTVCLLVSLGVIAIGVVALIVGMRGDTMTAKVGGAVIMVIGVLGAIACASTG
tara:strand:+ start:77 stop:241 length:165 start_codon:yes stop_codon:yes gene_type:complete